MITKEIQDKTWTSMSEECRQAYRTEYKYRVDFGTQEDEWEMEKIFGRRNLTSELDDSHTTAKHELKERINELQRVINFRTKDLRECYARLQQYKRKIAEIYERKHTAETFYGEDLAQVELVEMYKCHDAFKEQIKKQVQEQRECKKQLKEFLRKLCQHGK